jgi:hypothetical protein
MKSKFKLLLLVLSLFILSCNESSFKTNEKFPLEWIAGDYTDSEKNFFESWKISGDSLLNGVGYSVNGADTGFRESLSIRKVDDVWNYIVFTGNTETRFIMANSSFDSLVFENTENEFPKRITYIKKPENSILAIVENPGNPQMKILFNLTPKTK